MMDLVTDFRRDVLPIYLGPALPRWQPGSIDNVRTATIDGTLTERHWLDVKQEVGPGANANKELARDLASFANDGGAYIVGVAEDKQAGSLSVAPLALAGLAERIEQVALSRCDPPLYVICHPLQDENDPGKGVLLIEVPPSPMAPHMVDGEYFGRGDKTKYRLADAEVATLHTRRTARRLNGEEMIAREIERSPITSTDQTLAHLFLVAKPLASPADLLTPLVEKPHRLLEEIRKINRAIPDSSAFTPNLDYAAVVEPRPQGAGLHTQEIVARRFRPESGGSEYQQIDLEVADDGTLILFFGGASTPGNAGEYLQTEAVVGLTRGLVAIAGGLGAQAGYAGRWLLAMGLTNMQGRLAGAAYGSISFRPLPYSERNYVQATEAVTAELLSRPGAVTSRLVRRVLRALNDPADRYRRWLQDQE